MAIVGSDVTFKLLLTNIPPDLFSSLSFRTQSNSRVLTSAMALEAIDYSFFYEFPTGSVPVSANAHDFGVKSNFRRDCDPD